MSYYAAKEFCEADGGRPVQTKTQEEWDDLIYFADRMFGGSGGSGEVWVGLENWSNDDCDTADDCEGVLTWTDGSSFQAEGFFAGVEAVNGRRCLLASFGAAGEADGSIREAA